MLVEMFEKEGYWSFKDNANVDWITSLSVGTRLNPLEAKQDNKSKLKQVIKLKEAGFTADEILELIKEI
jgi:hypothetical protein